MNVLIFSSWYPSSKNFVSGIFVKEQVKALVKIGLSPVVYFPYDDSCEKNKLKVTIEDGVKTYRSNTEYMTNTKLARLLSIFTSFKQLKLICRNENIDIIHSHVCYKAGVVSSIFNKFHNIPYVITEHKSDIKAFSAKKYNFILFKNAYRRASYVITVSKFLSEELKSLGYSFRPMVIENVVNVEEYGINLGTNIKEYNMLFIGSMSTKVKGLDYLLPALAGIYKSSKFKFNIKLIGDGSRREYYKDLTKKLGINDIVTFTGNVPKEKIPEYISNCHFLVLSSIKETFGTVLIEALAGGKPVVATKCGGPCEIVKEKLGILVKSESIEELGKGLIKMMKTYEDYDFDYIKEYVNSNYSYKIIGNKLKDIYTEVLKRG